MFGCFLTFDLMSESVTLLACRRGTCLWAPNQYVSPRHFQARAQRDCCTTSLACFLYSQDCLGA